MSDGAVRASSGTTKDLWIPVPFATINALPKKHHSVYIAIENINETLKATELAAYRNSHQHMISRGNQTYIYIYIYTS